MLKRPSMGLPLGILLALPALLVAAPSDPLPPPEDNPKPAPQSAAAGADQESRKGRIEVGPPFQNIVDFQIGSGDKSKPAGIAAFLKARLTEPPIAAIPAPGAESAPAVPPVTVRGRFLDQQKRPIAEVSVTFVSLTGKVSYQ